MYARQANIDALLRADQVTSLFFTDGNSDLIICSFKMKCALVTCFLAIKRVQLRFCPHTSMTMELTTMIRGK